MTNTLGAVAAATPEAREAGAQMLAEGGNAFDAIVAAAVALAVTEPANSGLGGEGYGIFYDACTAQTSALCFTGVPGGLVQPAQLAGKDLIRGVHGPLVPGDVAGWCALIEEKCSKPASELLAPAIRLAEEGFEIDWPMAGGLNWMREQFHPTAHAIFVHPERPWQGGDWLRQPELAQTLRQIAEDGAAAFYCGEFAECMDGFFRESGGLLRKEDLACYQPLWQQTLHRRFGEVEVHVPAPESTGFSMLYGLELLVRLGYAVQGAGSLPALRMLIAVIGELEDCADQMAARMLPYAPEVEDAVAQLFEDETLAHVAAMLRTEAADACAPRGSHTTSLSACDRQGNLACITQTLDHAFGCGVVIPGTGVLMNSGMAWVNTDPASQRVDLVSPRRRNFLPIVPTLALDGNGRPLLALGTPGGFSIPQTTLQVYANLLFHGDDLQTAIDKPRLTVGTIVPEDGHNRRIHLEPGFSAEAYTELTEAEGDTDFHYFGKFHAVQRMPDGNTLAVNDQRIY